MERSSIEDYSRVDRTRGLLPYGYFHACHKATQVPYIVTKISFRPDELHGFMVRELSILKGFQKNKHENIIEYAPIISSPHLGSSQRNIP